MATNGQNGTNGQHGAPRSLRPGIYAPIPTFFLPESEDLDLPAFTAHVLRIARAGVTPLLAGSMGEAHHLTPPERSSLIRAARRALDDAGLVEVPIVAGTGAGSTRETVSLCVQAASAGADAAIVICSGYFAGVLVGNKEALKAFWREVAEKSPIPVIIYNYPGAAGGIDLDSGIITDLASSCPNIVGVKLTCGNVGKLTRICATVSTPGFADAHPRTNAADRFLVLGGFADFLLPSAFASAHGAITGLANVAPHTIVRLYALTTASLADPSQLLAAQVLQGIVANADATVAVAGVAGTKALLDRLYGYGGAPRKPLPPYDEAAGEALWRHEDVVRLVAVERELSGKAEGGKQ